MKKLLLRFVMLFVAAVFSNSTFAQSSVLATLSHDGTVTPYYGVSALKEAYDAAVDGDVVTLSSGLFTAVDLTKSVSIHGAGMALDTIKVIEPTVIAGDFKINRSSSETASITIEGIYHNGIITYDSCHNTMFIKCRLTDFNYSSQTPRLKEVSFVHCRIGSSLKLGQNCSASLINCVAEGCYCYDSKTSNFEFRNCVLRGQPSNIISSILRNCIIIATHRFSTFPKNNSFYNNIGINSETIFPDLPNQTNKRLTEYTSVFKTYTGEPISTMDNETFELTDAAKTTYLGDGTEVGIHGGSFPFDPAPTIPQITKCKVASKSTADGKLSVDIEVGVAEQQ